MPVTTCEQCPLRLRQTDATKKVKVYQARRFVAETRFVEVPFRGPTSGVDIMVVGESPGAQELYQKKPFVGESGKVVEAEFRANRVDPNSVFFANSCRCMLTADDKKVKEVVKNALASCRPALELAIRKLMPKLLLVFGDIALKQVLKQSGITQKRGKVQWSEEFQCWVFPTYHPAYCLRDQGNFVKWRPDIAQAIQFVRNGCVLDARETEQYEDAETIRPFLDKKDYTVALDTETQGKEWTDPNSVVISYSLSDTAHSGVNVWLATEVDLPSEADMVIRWPRKVGKKVERSKVYVKKAPEFDRKIEELRELCQRPDIKLVMMNGNYDLHRLAQLGIPRSQVVSYTMDIQLAMHALDPDMFKKCSLLDIQSAVIPSRMDHKTAFAQQVDKSDMLAAAKQDPVRHTNYAVGDTASTFECAQVLRRKLAEDRQLANYYIHLAHPVTTEVLYEIERNGIGFDSARLPDVKDAVAKFLSNQTREFKRLCPPKIIEAHRAKGFRLTRTEILKDVLFSREGYGLKPLEKTPTGDPSTNRKVLVRLREELPDDHPVRELLNIYIGWGPYQKLYSTYLKGFEEALCYDGRLHTQISKTGTATGRTSSTRPNLQNIPKRNKAIMQLIRSLLVASPGTVFVAADYSQNELRWAGHDAQERTFLKVFREGGDLHLVTAAQILKSQGIDIKNAPQDQVKKARQSAKSQNFGLLYGMSAGGFQIYARDEYGVHLTLAESEHARHVFLNVLYRDLPAWHERRRNEARRNGFIRTPFGSIRRTPNILSDDSGKRGEDERVAVNTPIQAAGNDTCLFGALHAKRTGVVDGVRAKLVLFIHDELIYEVQEDHVDSFVPQLIECMENPPLKKYFGIDLTVPLVVDVKVGQTLATLEEYHAK